MSSFSFLPQDPSQGPTSARPSPGPAHSPSTAPPYEPRIARFAPTHTGEAVSPAKDADGTQAVRQDQRGRGAAEGSDPNSLNLNGGQSAQAVASASSFVFPAQAPIDNDDYALPVPPPFAALDPSLLPPVPSSPTSQIRLLRQMDEDADAALTANQTYQEQLLEVMKRLDWARKRAGEVAALVTALQSELHQDSELRIVHEHFSEPALPWFKWLYGKDLPPNPDGQARDRYLATIRSIPWSTAERAQLKQEVIAQNHRLVAQEALRRGEDLTVAIASKSASWFSESLEGIDWERIALVVDRRTPTECRIQYTQRDHPLLNHPNVVKWTEGEKQRLYEVAEKFGGRDWMAIAEEHGTNRTPADCLRVWRRRPGQNKFAGFTKEDDEKIKEGVRLFGENWQAVARHTNLSSGQVQTRWSKTLHPTIQRGKWSPEEDAALVAAVATLGKSWREVEKRVGGRTDAQCRERWVNMLDPKLKDRHEWSEEEEATLLRLRDQEGLSWAEIARKGFDDTRTDNHCMRRYQLIQRRALPEHLRPRIGRPPKGSRGQKTGRPKKTAKQRLKEKEEKEELERELDEMDRREWEEWVRTNDGEEGTGGGGVGEMDNEAEEEEVPPEQEKSKGRSKATKPKPAAPKAGRKRKIDALEPAPDQREETQPQAGPSNPAANKRKKAHPVPVLEMDAPSLPSTSSSAGRPSKGMTKGKGKKRAREVEEEEQVGEEEQVEEATRGGRRRKKTTTG
ncbi:hypothetical protein JCM11251_001630 [Rhodosporidiobolus azoricus]